MMSVCTLVRLFSFRASNGRGTKLTSFSPKHLWRVAGFAAPQAALCMPWYTAEPAELLSWCMVLHCVGVENSCLKLFTACQFSYFHGTCSVFHNAVPQSALLSRVRVNCYWFVSIYLSLSFIYMWTGMLMTLHILLFHPILVILTHKKVLHSNFFFQATI